MLALASYGFSAPLSSKACAQSRAAVSMSGAQLDRRGLLQTAAGAVLAAGMPLAAQADGANNPLNALKAKQIYGSRIWMLQTGTAQDVLSEKNAFQLLITGAFRTVDKKEIRAELTKLSKKILKAAEGGTVDKESLAAFLKLAKVDQNYYDNPLGIANPKQRRNAGAPTTDTITDQMGSYSYALYQPLNKGDPLKTK